MVQVCQRRPVLSQGQRLKAWDSQQSLGQPPTKPTKAWDQSLGQPLKGKAWDGQSLGQPLKRGARSLGTPEPGTEAWCQSLGQPLERGARSLGTPEPGTEAWNSN